MNNKIKQIVYSALFAALVLGAIQIHLPVPMNQGYVHLGDSLIYICAAILPFPFSGLAAGIGGAWADIIGGFAIWALPTFVIKLLMTLFFTSKSEKLLTVRNFVAVVLAGTVNVIGYYIA